MKGEGVRPGDEFILDLPSQPEHVGTARMFAAAVARRMAFDEETVDDLKIAISEACAGAIASVDPGDAIRIHLVGHPGGLRVVVSNGAVVRVPARSPVPAGLFEGDLFLGVVRGLFPDAVIATVDGGASISFTVPG